MFILLLIYEGNWLIRKEAFYPTAGAKRPLCTKIFSVKKQINYEG